MPEAARRCSHSGFSVATTNSTATATVTAWEKISQVLRMKEGEWDGLTQRSGDVPALAAGRGAVPRLWAERFAGGGPRRDRAHRFRRHREPRADRSGRGRRRRHHRRAPWPDLARTGWAH